jgi:nicotinamidase-related amidase
MHLEFDFPEPVRATLNPAVSTLIVVDMQNEYCRPEGLRYNPRTDSIIPNLRSLLNGTREAGAKVIFVQSVRANDAIEFTVFGRKRALLEGSWNAEIVDDLAPMPHEPVVQKHSHDCFNHTGLDSLLEELGMRPGVDNVLVTGVATSGCVSCAISGFSCRDYRVWVPMDCTASRAPEHEALTYLKFSNPAYSYNTSFTRSTLIEWLPGSDLGAVQPAVAAAG